MRGQRWGLACLAYFIVPPPANKCHVLFKLRDKLRFRAAKSFLIRISNADTKGLLVWLSRLALLELFGLIDYMH